MKTLSEQEFLRRVEQSGIGVDPRYPQSAVLRFRPESGDARFWCIPPDPERRPYFIGSLLELMGDWQSCYAWRHLGSWPDSVDRRRLSDVVELRILKGLGLPLGTADVVEFVRDELDTLVTLIFSTTVFGVSVGEDLYVVPNHASYILKTDHHDVIHIDFRLTEEVDRWVSEMTKRGFPLPGDLPDETFKQPTWMKRKNS
jgi:hypothetical protein